MGLRFPNKGPEKWIDLSSFFSLHHHPQNQSLWLKFSFPFIIVKSLTYPLHSQQRAREGDRDTHPPIIILNRFTFRTCRSRNKTAGAKKYGNYYWFSIAVDGDFLREKSMIYLLGQKFRIKETSCWVFNINFPSQRTSLFAEQQKKSRNNEQEGEFFIE